MKILLTGASGLIGTALAPVLTQQGHQVVKLSRHRQNSTCWWDPQAGAISLPENEPLEAVIHLAGETVAQTWTSAAKARIRQSRVQGTQLLSEAVSHLPRQQQPRLFICASATGYYGDRGSEVVDETSASGTGFLAEVCREWEAATASAAKEGIRVVHLRIGIVLTSSGGALGKMLSPFRMGLGGKLGNGKQYWSWIALDDLLRVIQHTLLLESAAGPINAVSPHPVTNAEFTGALASVLRRPAIFSVPAIALKLMLGEMSEMLLASCRVRPARLEGSGFVWQYPNLEGTLRHGLGG